jgi:hypothetical protein
MSRNNLFADPVWVFGLLTGLMLGGTLTFIMMLVLGYEA